MATELATMNETSRRTVAVPDSFDPKALFRLGVQSNSEDAAITVGAKGPGGQRLMSIFLQAADSIISINLDSGELTLITGEDENLQAVTYDVDAEAMLGSVIQVAETFDVIFSTGDQSFVDETAQVRAWLLTTGAQYPNLGERLPVDDIVATAREQIEKATELGHVGHASRPPSSARPIERPETVNEYALWDQELEPEAVQIPNGENSYVGRLWETPGQTTTLHELVESGYKAALIEFKNGEKAILLPNFRNGVGIQIKIHNRMIDRILSSEAMNMKLGAGERLEAHAVSSFEGDTSMSGPFASPPITQLTAMADQTRDHNLQYRVVDFFSDFHVGPEQTVKEALPSSNPKQKVAFSKHQER